MYITKNFFYFNGEEIENVNGAFISNLKIENGIIKANYNEKEIIISEDNFNYLMTTTTFCKGISNGKMIALFDEEDNIFFVNKNDEKYKIAINNTIILKKDLNIGDLFVNYEDNKEYIFLGNFFSDLQGYDWLNKVYQKHFSLLGVIEPNNKIKFIRVNPNFFALKIIENINIYSSKIDNLKFYKLSLEDFHKEKTNIYLSKIQSNVLFKAKIEEDNFLLEDFKMFITKENILKKIRQENKLEIFENYFIIPALFGYKAFSEIPKKDTYKVILYEFKNEIFKIFFY